jgi:hypothetical protein
VLEHLRGLADEIGTGTQFSREIFQGQFQALPGWLSYWNAMNGSVTQLFNTPGSLWGPSGFQRLYIACWLHRPVEKGSFMIPIIQPARQDTVRLAMEGLPSRWSSHLKGDGARSAGQGYRFLKGYSELLVQFETERLTPVPSLFLKTEGHSAVSLAHIASFITKVFTGSGNTANSDLHARAKSGEYGIAVRGAENYDKPYEALLGYLGMKGITHTVEEALPEIYRKLKTKARVVNEAPFDQIANRVAVGERIEKRLWVELITKSILPTINQADVGDGRYIGKLKAAEPALREIAVALEVDASEATIAAGPRIFQEVRVTLEQLDATVERFIQESHLWYNRLCERYAARQQQ